MFSIICCNIFKMSDMWRWGIVVQVTMIYCIWIMVAYCITYYMVKCKMHNKHHIVCYQIQTKQLILDSLFELFYTKCEILCNIQNIVTHPGVIISNHLCWVTTILNIWEDKSEVYNMNIVPQRVLEHIYNENLIFYKINSENNKIYITFNIPPPKIWRNSAL